MRLHAASGEFALRWNMRLDSVSVSWVQSPADATGNAVPRRSAPHGRMRACIRVLWDNLKRTTDAYRKTLRPRPHTHAPVSIA